MKWERVNVHLRDGVLPLAELLAKPVIDAMHLTFAPTRSPIFARQ